MSVDLSGKKKKLYQRFAFAYICWLCLPLLVLAFSLAQGGGWKPVVTGSAIYLTFIVGITYQFIKELRALKCEERETEEFFVQPPPSAMRSWVGTELVGVTQKAAQNSIDKSGKK